MNITEQEQLGAKKLSEALTAATDAGVFEGALLGIMHPDAINEFCDAIGSLANCRNCDPNEQCSQSGTCLFRNDVTPSAAVDMWLLIMGNPVDGFSYIGPFYSHEDATNAGEDAYTTGGGDWWVTRLERPTMRPKTKSEIIREIADSLGMKCIDMPLSATDPRDVVGLPIHK